jgi:hypothetical protein
VTKYFVAGVGTTAVLVVFFTIVSHGDKWTWQKRLGVLLQLLVSTMAIAILTFFIRPWIHSHCAVQGLLAADAMAFGCVMFGVLALVVTTDPFLPESVRQRRRKLDLLLKRASEAQQLAHKDAP